jgi:hypothetical protein
MKSHKTSRRIALFAAAFLASAYVPAPVLVQIDLIPAYGAPSFSGLPGEAIRRLVANTPELASGPVRV